MDMLATGARTISDATQRFASASEALVKAASRGDIGEAAEAAVNQIAAKASFGAGLATVRIADEMMQALLELNQRG